MNRKLSYAEALERDSQRLRTDHFLRMERARSDRFLSTDHAPSKPDLGLRRQKARRVFYWLAIWAIAIAFVLLLSLDGWN